MAAYLRCFINLVYSYYRYNVHEGVGVYVAVRAELEIQAIDVDVLYWTRTQQQLAELTLYPLFVHNDTSTTQSRLQTLHYSPLSNEARPLVCL